MYGWFAGDALQKLEWVYMPKFSNLMKAAPLK